MAGASTSPVTPAVLRWALDEDGRSDVDLADALSIDEDDLLAWVAGEARPTVGQVTALAKVLKRPRALFFLPKAPDRAALPAFFRHPPGAARLVSVNARRWVRQARRLQEAVAWALRNEPPVELPQAVISADPEATALDVRHWLGVEVSARWNSDHAALAAWRSALDGRGVLALNLPIGKGEVRGFASWDERAPLVAVNASRVSAAARVYTIGHELGHLITRTDAACVTDADVAPQPGFDVERWCQVFAAALLMPVASVGALAAERRIGQGAATLDDVRALSSRCRVTVYAAALRLRDLGLSDASLYSRTLAAYPPPSDEALSTASADDEEFRSSPLHVLRLREYGPRALELVLGNLPAVDALSLLRMDVPAVRRLSETLPGADAVL